MTGRTKQDPQGSSVRHSPVRGQFPAAVRSRARSPMASAGARAPSLIAPLSHCRTDHASFLMIVRASSIVLFPAAVLAPFVPNRPLHF